MKCAGAYAGMGGHIKWLFEIYVNDLPGLLECMVLIFADEAIKKGDVIVTLQH